MAEDVTQHFEKDKKKEPASESKIFNTSVRGWIALILALSLSLSMLSMIVAYCFGVKIPPEIAATMLTLFTGAVTGALTHYFQQRSKEGQKD